VPIWGASSLSMSLTIPRLYLSIFVPMPSSIQHARKVQDVLGMKMSCKVCQGAPSKHSFKNPEPIEGPTKTGTGNELVEPVSMNRFFKKYIKYLNFNEKNIF
jgi:hypothetical protein